MDRDPTAGFRKLNFLLSSPPFPRETFANLLLLYCKPQHPFYDLAADVMAENPELVASLLDKVRPAALGAVLRLLGAVWAAAGPAAGSALAVRPAGLGTWHTQHAAGHGFWTAATAAATTAQDLRDFLEAAISRRASPEESLRRLDELSGRHVDRLRRLTKAIQDARLARDQEAVRRAVNQYDEALEGYIPGGRAGAGRQRPGWAAPAGSRAAVRRMAACLVPGQALARVADAALQDVGPS
jgi:tetratricopeptide repeat protein 30